MTVALDFAFGAVATEAPQAWLRVTDLLASQPIAVIEGASEPGHRVLGLLVPTAAFDAFCPAAAAFQQHEAACR